MIINFSCKYTERVWEGEFVKKFPSEVQIIARRKLRMIYAASNISALKIPPSNRFKKLKGNKNHLYSIRINDQWRICFEWRGNNSYHVEIIDYH